jgi:hypothetical protein
MTICSVYHYKCGRINSYFYKVCREPCQWKQISICILTRIPQTRLMLHTPNYWAGRASLNNPVIYQSLNNRFSLPSGTCKHSKLRSRNNYYFCLQVIKWTYSSIQIVRCILHLNCCYYISHFSLPVSRRVSIGSLCRFYLIKTFDECLNALKLQWNASCNVKKNPAFCLRSASVFYTNNNTVYIKYITAVWKCSFFVFNSPKQHSKT